MKSLVIDKLYTYNGKTMSVRDWCKAIGFYWSLFDNGASYK